MSGDVQPRKRKDKKRKKDDLGVSEPRGTSAALGEGDIFMHSQHDHGTGGHWCAKVIFFSLLAILVALIGLIILENRGLSELEANSVQSQYSGVLEGWLEDAPDDDHHDSHTLELNHHDDEDDAEHSEEVEHSDEVEGDDHDEDDETHDDDDAHDDDGEDESPEDDENQDSQGDDEDETQESDEEAQDDEDGSQEQDLEANDEDEELPYRRYYHGNEAEPDEGDDDDDDEEEEKDADDNEEENEELSNKGDVINDDEANTQSLEDDEQEDEGGDTEENDVNEYNNENNEADSEENNNEDEEEHDEDEEEDTSLEVEKLEQEAAEDEEPISAELPALPEPDDDDDNSKVQDSVEDEPPEADDNSDEVNEPDDDFLEADDDEPPVERITAPAGKPFVEEEEEETSSEKPADTLAEEEEYEKRQEELRKEEAQASHMWLKLTVGGALLVATHAIVRRATASSDTPTEQRVTREATPVDRRMTLIPEEPTESVPIRKVKQDSDARPVVQEVTKQIPSVGKFSPAYEDSEEEVEEEEEETEEPIVTKVAQAVHSAKDDVKQELYSDEEEEVEEEEKVVVKKAVPQVAKPPTPEPDDDVPDDVEIIEDEQIEEEAEEVEEDEDDEEEISDVDDEELLTRLEAKYGRLPEPERPQRRKDGGNSIEDEWPGEPSDAYWRQQLDQAEQEFNQAALRGSGRARRLRARALDAAAERRRDNALLAQAIAAYRHLLEMSERLSDDRLLEAADRTIDRILFRGTYLNAEPIYRLLIRRFPDNPSHRTNLTVMFLMANRADLAENVLKETLQRWPDDRLALAQYGFVLKTEHNRLEEAAEFLQRALEGDTGPAAEPRYYYHLGDTLLLLGRFKEAHEVHKRAASHGHFLSAAQRSLYNVPRLKGQPWWNVDETPYANLARALEKSWRAILREGEAAKALFEQEKEGLKERGEWSQLELFARGREVPGRCARAPAACAAVRAEPAAAACRRGQVKFSALRAGTHVRPHVGPTNCRLRMHLALSNTRDTFIRVDQEIRQWEEGKVFIFDDSFEHEVWHNGTGSRLVLIVDVWHPELTAAERTQLPAI